MQPEMPTSDAVYIRPVIDISVVPIERKPFPSISVIDEVHEKIANMRKQTTRSAIHDVIPPWRQWAITGHRYSGGIIFHIVLSRERIEVSDSIAMQH